MHPFGPYIHSESQKKQENRNSGGYVAISLLFSRARRRVHSWGELFDRNCSSCITYRVPVRFKRRYEVIFEIEIYAIDKSINNKKVSRNTIIQELEKLVYETFEEHYGLLGGKPTTTPNADTNVARETISFTGKIKNNIIYRR